jgi:hypothetical protein
LEDEATSKNWEAAAIHDFVHGGMSYAEIGSKYGRDRDTIRRLMKAKGIKREVEAKKGGRESFDKQVPISQVHRVIGTYINHHREIQLHQNLTEYAAMLGVSRFTLQKMERGLHDFTISDLVKLGFHLGRKPVELLTLISTPSQGASWLTKASRNTGAQPVS